MAIPPDRKIDPVALFEALHKARDGSPGALDDHYEALFAVMERYWTGNAPQSRKSRHNPLRKIEHDLVAWTRRRAVETILDWKKDILAFEFMPGAAIDQWFRGEMKSQDKKADAVISEAQKALNHTDFEGSFEDFSNAYYPRNKLIPPPPSEAFCKFFGLPHPSLVFCGPSEPMPKKINEKLQWLKTAEEVPHKSYMQSKWRYRMRRYALPDGHPEKLCPDQELLKWNPQ